MSDHVYNILFLSSRNAARSIMAEAILNHLGKGRFRAFSAGSNPVGRVDPLAIEQLRLARLPIDGLRSKRWDAIATAGAPHLDFVFTICNQAAGEEPPAWPGRPLTAHWGIDDPTVVEGSDKEKHRAFSLAFALLNRRISIFINLPFATLDSLTLKQELDNIGRLHEQGQ